MPLTAKALKGVKQPFRGFATATLCRAIEAAIEVKDDLTLTLVHLSKFWDASWGGQCAGAYFDADATDARILIGAEPSRYWTDAMHLAYMWQVLGHELAHYEQWRDNRPLVERGVNVRGRKIARLVKQQLPAVVLKRLDAPIDFKSLDAVQRKELKKNKVDWREAGWGLLARLS